MNSPDIERTHYEELYALAQNSLKSPNALEQFGQPIQGAAVTSELAFRQLFHIYKKLLPHLSNRFTDGFIHFNATHESQHLERARRIFGEHGTYHYGLAPYGEPGNITHIQPLFHYETDQQVTTQQKIEILKAPDVLSIGDYTELHHLYAAELNAPEQQAIIERLISDRIPHEILASGDTPLITKHLVDNAILHTSMEAQRGWLAVLEERLPPNEFPNTVDFLIHEQEIHMQKIFAQNENALLVYGIGYAERDSGEGNMVLPFTIDISSYRI